MGWISFPEHQHGTTAMPAKSRPPGKHRSLRMPTVCLTIATTSASSAKDPAIHRQRSAPRPQINARRTTPQPEAEATRQEILNAPISSAAKSDQCCEAGSTARRGLCHRKASHTTHPSHSTKRPPSSHARTKSQSVHPLCQMRQHTH